MSDYVIGFIVGYSFLVFVGIVWRNVSAWRNRRIVREARPSITVEKYDKMLKAAYSSDDLIWRHHCPACKPSREEKQP